MFVLVPLKLQFRSAVEHKSKKDFAHWHCKAADQANVSP